MWNKAIVYAGVILAMIFWSFSFLWYKDVYLYLQPFTTIFVRLTISSALLFFFSLVFRKLQKIKPGDMKMFFSLALFEPFLYFIGESLGMQYVSPTTAAIIISVVPLLVPVMAYFFLKEKLTVKNIVGIVISFFGVILVVINKDFEFAASPQGVVLMFVAVIGAVFYSIFLKKLTAGYNIFTIISWQNLLGAIMFLPLVLIYDIKEWHPSMITPGAAIAVLKLAILASTIAFLFYSKAVQVLGAVRSNIFTNLIPILTAFFSFVFLGENLLLHNFLGILLAISGLILSQVDRSIIRKFKIRQDR